MSTLSLTKSYVKYWKPLLRLKDWKIEIKVTTDPDEEFMGQLTHWRKDQEAILTVLKPELIPEDWRGVRDLEVTVVHELLHLRIIDCVNHNKNTHNFVELLVETLAQLLVSQRRGISPEELK